MPTSFFIMQSKLQSNMNVNEWGLSKANYSSDRVSNYLDRGWTPQTWDENLTIVPLSRLWER